MRLKLADALAGGMPFPCYKVNVDNTEEGLKRIFNSNSPLDDVLGDKQGSKFGV